MALVSYRFGNQGSAQAQNLRDSGIPNESILIANLEDSYAEAAKAKGFIVEHDFERAAEVADGGYPLLNKKAWVGVHDLITLITSALSAHT